MSNTAFGLAKMHGSTLNADIVKFTYLEGLDSPIEKILAFKPEQLLSP